jgi:hypothetical protein
MKKNCLLLFLLGLFVFQTGFAVNDTLWGNDPIRAKERYTIFSDDVKAKNYLAAKANLYWLLTYKTCILKAIFQDGHKVYENLANAEKDETLKRVYQDSALWLYDQRIKCFGDEANVLNRKGLVAFSYWQNRPEKYSELFDLYQKITLLNGDKTFNHNINLYMYLTAEMKRQKQKDISEEKFLEIFNQLEKIIQNNLNKNDHLKPEWEKVKIQVNQLFSSGAENYDCEFVKKIYTPKFKENPKDTVMLEKITGLMLKGDCTGEPFFLEVITALVKEQPSFKGYKSLAAYSRKNGDLAGYVKNMQEAFKYGGTPQDKAEFNLILAQDLAKQAKYAEARQKALEALKLDNSLTNKVYSLIGDMYMNSANICKGPDPKNPCHARAVFIAAYNAYQKAGNSAGMARARQFFPTKEDIFTYSMGGQTVNVGCWIQEIVTIPGL